MLSIVYLIGLLAPLAMLMLLPMWNIYWAMVNQEAQVILLPREQAAWIAGVLMTSCIYFALANALMHGECLIRRRERSSRRTMKLFWSMQLVVACIGGLFALDFNLRARALLEGGSPRYEACQTSSQLRTMRSEFLLDRRLAAQCSDALWERIYRHERREGRAYAI
ncbi:hypothetical protein A5892_18230 [Halotalea alkalilenta]|uniref:Uncharacterized protein n=1 Tax=Halotalea alkalilenta TaxID=376489 RepID=A0A172YIW1_9GAMM|nr:hypothetical protein A5892_18230 [Halotalea alkalilenta]